MEKDKKVTAEYVNNKMESMVSAMFDTMMETEERLKNLDSTQFGYDCFGLKDNVRRDALELIKRKVLKLGI